MNVYLCSKSQIKLYCTFCLKSVEIFRKKNFNFNRIVETNILNIYKDYTDIIKKNAKFDDFKKKYFSFGSETKKNIQDELYGKFHLYKYEDIEYTYNYFNSLCFWNLFYLLININLPFKYIGEYVKVYNKLKNNIDLNYIDKSMILIDFVQRSFEDKSKLIYPKLFFYNELDDNNPYKIASNFQYEIINNITEESCLFQPFLLLDSYIMDSIQTNINFSFIKILKPAYSISMLTVEIIKDHLRKTIKNYFFVLEKQGEHNRKYYVSIKKFSNLIIYNENILLCDSNYDKMYELSEEDIIIKPEIINNYAFILNLENLHENFAHIKELILNIKKSPILYFDRNLNFAYIYHYETEEYGESGRLIEAFICRENLIDEIKKNIYEMGDFLKVDYYVGKDFKRLIDGFINIFKNYKLEEKKELNFLGINSSSIYCNEKVNNSAEEEKKKI